jgi:hypothetical protein
MTSRPARRYSRPKNGKKLPGGRIADRLSMPSREILDMLDRLPEDTGTQSRLVTSRQIVLITFRKDGTRVATPVWAAVDGGVVHVRTQRASGKVKRLRRNTSVLLAPCTTRGVPLATAVPGQARLLDSGEEHAAERAIRRKYGLVRAFCALVQDLLRVDMCYLEITLDN